MFLKEVPTDGKKYFFFFGLGWTLTKRKNRKIKSFRHKLLSPALLGDKIDRFHYQGSVRSKLHRFLWLQVTNKLGQQIENTTRRTIVTASLEVNLKYQTFSPSLIRFQILFFFHVSGASFTVGSLASAMKIQFSDSWQLSKGSKFFCNFFKKLEHAELIHLGTKK